MSKDKLQKDITHGFCALLRGEKIPFKCVYRNGTVAIEQNTKLTYTKLAQLVRPFVDRYGMMQRTSINPKIFVSDLPWRWVATGQYPASKLNLKIRDIINYTLRNEEPWDWSARNRRQKQ